MLDSHGDDKSGSKDFKELKVGDISPFRNDRRIGSIIFNDGDYALLKHEDDDMLWLAYTDGPKHFHYQNIQHEFSRLRDKSKTFLSGNQHKIAENLLTTAVIRSCRLNPDDNYLETFKTANEYIEQEILYRNYRNFYILIIFATIIGFAVWVSFNYSTPLGDEIYYKFIGAGIFGMFGAILSMLNHIKKSEKPSIPQKDLVHDSIQNLIYGFISGIVIVLFILGDIILGFANKHNLGIFALAVCAGFSNRFVSDLIRGMVKRSTSKTGN